MSLQESKHSQKPQGSREVNWALNLVFTLSTLAHEGELELLCSQETGYKSWEAPDQGEESSRRYFSKSGTPKAQTLKAYVN